VTWPGSLLPPSSSRSSRSTGGWELTGLSRSLSTTSHTATGANGRDLQESSRPTRPRSGE
ncbi:unnamed protein product, partial [Symbiodinium sp. KB8]